MISYREQLEITIEIKCQQLDQARERHQTHLDNCDWCQTENGCCLEADRLLDDIDNLRDDIARLQ